jgi:hypothetical protein
MRYVVLTFKDGIFRSNFLRSFMQFQHHNITFDKWSDQNNERFISYVFNLEWRKYFAVWFFISRKEFNVYQHDIYIFMNMIIWPLMTYTVTSFGKAFAHVRNLSWLYFLRKKPDMKFIILVSNLKEISPSVFSWKKRRQIISKRKEHSKIK